MNDDFCEKHGTPLKCLAGHSAHPLNWYCPDCDKEKEANPTTPAELNKNQAQKIAKLQAQVAALEADKLYMWKVQDELVEQCDNLQAQVAELENPGWEQFINLATQWLEKYPPNIFTGESGDPGPLFVVALRNALAALKENEWRG